jgi:hypothetical protein
MGRLFKLLFWVAFFGGLLLFGSYLGARARAGMVLGPRPPTMGSRHIAFLNRAADLPNRPLAWVFTFTGTAVPGAHQVKIYISPTGQVLATVPRDLAARLEAYERTRLP